MKTAVVTSFPLNYPTWVEMIASFDKYWSKDIDLFISIDKISQSDFETLQININKLMPSGRQFFISNEWSDDKEDFFKRNTDSPDLPYRFHVCKFSHKVFALYGAYQQLKETHDYIIWLDADAITYEQFSGLDFVEDAATLQRIDAPHSECSYMQFNLKAKGGDIIEKMYDYYVTDKVLELAGWTDCDVFDAVAKDYRIKNLSEGIKGWHVFPQSIVGKYIEHRKGQRKTQAANTTSNPIYDADNLNIKTRNCLPNENILKNIKENLNLIKNWVEYIKPHEEEVVICSAGESLSYTDIKEWADKGVKIVTVKHAINRLKDWNIKPWACVLLDPRPHVESFVQIPDKDVIYFVASMVDPSVVKTLLLNGCKVVGYHAFVNAGEKQLLSNGDMLICGGSATATRSIGLLTEALGFKKIHCYGYDLCYNEKPDFSKKDDEGNLKYIEITLSATGWKHKKYNKTFWTEGQFLAQAQELMQIYKTHKEIDIAVYGSGIAGWQYSHYKQAKSWECIFNNQIELKKQNSVTLDEWNTKIRNG